MSDQRTVLRDARLPDGRVADVTITDGAVSHIGSSERVDRDNIFLCRHQLLIPAAIDMHVHMRDGKQADKETWISGTRSALAGGVGFVVDQPNTIPPLLTRDACLERLTLAQQGYTHFAINGGISSGCTKADIEAVWESGVLAFGEIFFGPSSYGEPISEQMLVLALQECDAFDSLMTLHAEVVLGGEDVSLKTHDELRSIEGECAAIQTIIGLLHQNEFQKEKSRLPRMHICHVSSAQGIRMVAPLSHVSSEATPHHLLLSRDTISSDDMADQVWYKMNPPLRTEKERKDLLQCWPLIDVIASDHAPHSVSDKGSDFSSAPSGVPGVETMVPLFMAKVREGSLSLADLIQKTVTSPAALLGIEPPGCSVGSRADFALYPNTITRIDGEKLHSKAGWSPFDGMDALFPSRVFIGGEVAYDASGDVFTQRDTRWFCGKGFTGSY